MFYKNKMSSLKYVLAAIMLAVLASGCSIQGYIAKKVAVHVGKKIYHGIKDQGEEHKERKTKHKAHKPSRDEEPE